MNMFYIIVLIICIYVIGYYSGRNTVPGWTFCKDQQPQQSGYYLVTIDSSNYAEVFFFDIYEGVWRGRTEGKVIAWRERIKGV